MRSFIVLPINFLGEDIYLNRAACNHRSAQSDEQASFPVMRKTNVPFLRGVAVILRRIAESTRFFVLDGEIEAETRLTMVVADGRIDREIRIAGTGVVPSGKLNIDLVRSIDANSICRSIWKEAEHGDWIHVPHIALHHPLVGSEPQIIRGE